MSDEMKHYDGVQKELFKDHGPQKEYGLHPELAKIDRTIIDFEKLSNQVPRHIFSELEERRKQVADAILEQKYEEHMYEQKVTQQMQDYEEWEMFKKQAAMEADELSPKPEDTERKQGLSR